VTVHHAALETAPADADVDDRAQHWGSPRAFAAAPGGHLVEVMEFPPHEPRGGGV
jgi:hypothetical protein